MSDRLRPARELARRAGCSPADAFALAVLALVSLCALGALWLLTRPTPAGITGAANGAPTPAASDPAGLSVTGGDVVVHVAGAVAMPGVYTLPGGSRVGDAVNAAGGPRRHAVLDGLNLARALTDGEQVVVPDRRAMAAGPPAQRPSDTAGNGGTTGGEGDGTVNLNQADAATLETLPNIGPVLAERIIQHRESIGGFTSVGELRDVTGIGEKTFQALAELVSV